MNPPAEPARVAQQLPVPPSPQLPQQAQEPQLLQQQPLPTQQPLSTQQPLIPEPAAAAPTMNQLANGQSPFLAQTQMPIQQQPDMQPRAQPEIQSTRQSQPELQTQLQPQPKQAVLSENQPDAESGSQSTDALDDSDSQSKPAAVPHAVVDSKSEPKQPGNESAQRDRPSAAVKTEGRAVPSESAVSESTTVPGGAGESPEPANVEAGPPAMGIFSTPAPTATPEPDVSMPDLSATPQRNSPPSPRSSPDAKAEHTESPHTSGAESDAEPEIVDDLPTIQELMDIVQGQERLQPNEWRFIETPEALAQLFAYLDDSGARNLGLLSELRKHESLIVRSMNERLRRPHDETAVESDH